MTITGASERIPGVFQDNGGLHVNPKHPDYGAKGDDKSVSDGAITSGAAVLTSATAAFVSADAGKTCVVAGAATPVAGSGNLTAVAGAGTFAASQAGVIVDGCVVIVGATSYTVSAFNGTTGCTLSGAPTFGASAFTIAHNLSTTILSYTNATTVTLAANAARTVSGAYVGYGTDDTAAFVAAVAAATSANSRMIRVPAGRFVWTSSVTNGTGYTFVGEGVGRSTIVFRPTADDTALEINAGAAVCYNNTLRGLSFYSDDTKWTKVAVEVSDVSSLAMEDISISGQRVGLASFWSGGAGSIGLRTKGREATGLKNLKIVADRPIVIDANPNTARTDGEDIDHWHGHGFYLVANGYYNIEVVAGIGISNLKLQSQAWVGGIGGFKMNDTRAAPTITSRHITFENVRGEQVFDPSGYLFNIVATAPIQAIAFVDCLGAATMQGIKVDGYLQLSLDNCIMATAAGKNSLLAQGATGGSVITMRGCYWQPASVFTVTGMTATAIEAFNSTLTVGPSTATYVNVLTGTLVNVGTVTANVAAGTVGSAAQATGSGDVFVVIPAAAGSGATLRALNNARSDFTPLNIAALDYTLKTRTGVGTTEDTVRLTAAGLALNVVGKGFLVKEGTNATSGTATLAAGTVVVSTTKVTASSRVHLTGNSDGGTPGWVRVSARTAATSFTITSSSGTDTSTVAWIIIEPAP